MSSHEVVVKIRDITENEEAQQSLVKLTDFIRNEHGFNGS